MLAKLFLAWVLVVYQGGIAIVWGFFGLCALWYKGKGMFVRGREQAAPTAAAYQYYCEKLGWRRKLAHAAKFDLWLHGCSAGEINLAQEVLYQWIKAHNWETDQRRAVNVRLTYQSHSGRQRAAALAHDANAWGSLAPQLKLDHHYIPLDFYPILRRDSKRLAKKAPLVLVEEDMWPMLLHTLKWRHHKRYLVHYELNGEKRQLVYKWLPYVFRFTHQVNVILTVSKQSEARVAKILTSSPTLFTNISPVGVERWGDLGPNKQTMPDVIAEVNKIGLATMGNMKTSARLLGEGKNALRLNTLTQRFPYPAAQLLSQGLKPLRDPSAYMVVLGSSHDKEEEFVIAALAPYLRRQQAQPRVGLVLVLRHPERGRALLAKLRQHWNVGYLDQAPVPTGQTTENIVSNLKTTKNTLGNKLTIQDLAQQGFLLPRTTTSKSTSPTGENGANLQANNVASGDGAAIIVVAQLGYLPALYAAADLVLIGDTFAQGNGGHNFLEATATGAPTCYGPYMKTFAELRAGFEQEKATLRLTGTTPQILRTEILSLLTNPSQRSKMGRKAYARTQKLTYREDILRKVLSAK